MIPDKAWIVWFSWRQSTQNTSCTTLQCSQHTPLVCHMSLRVNPRAVAAPIFPHGCLFDVESRHAWRRPSTYAHTVGLADQKSYSHSDSLQGLSQSESAGAPSSACPLRLATPTPKVFIQRVTEWIEIRSFQFQSSEGSEVHSILLLVN